MVEDSKRYAADLLNTAPSSLTRKYLYLVMFSSAPSYHKVPRTSHSITRSLGFPKRELNMDTVSVTDVSASVTRDDEVEVEKTASLPSALRSDRLQVEAEIHLKSAYRKMDIRLIAWYSFAIFCLCIQAHDITTAAIMNKEDGTDMQHQLGDLTSEQWALALSVMHYAHLVCEPFSAFLLKRFTPRCWMAISMISWSTIAMCHGAVQNFGGLITVRTLLGVAGGSSSGLMYHLSFWYPADRLTLRIAILLASAIIAGAPSGLLAFAISFLNDRAGMAGWRYLFILEGAPGLVCGIVTYFCLPNFPQDASFLSEVERASVLAALPKTQPNSTDKAWDWQQIKPLLRDPTFYTFCIIWMCHAIGAEGIMTALPNVMMSLGITGTATTQLLTMPPWILGSCCLLGLAWLIQTKRLNAWLVALCLEGTACAWYLALIIVESPKAKYVLMVFAITATICLLPLLWPERIRAANGTASSALALGLTTDVAILSGIIGPQMWQKRYAPSYQRSYAASLGLLTVVLLAIAVTWMRLRRRYRAIATSVNDIAT